jgi:hypothetical protein
MFAICMQGTSAQGRTGIGTVIVRGEDVWLDLTQQADPAKASISMEEDMTGAEAYLSLWMRAEKRAEERIGEIKAEIGQPELLRSLSERSTWFPSH